MYYAVDRLEETLAVLQDDEEHTVSVARDLLPVDTVQGDVLVLKDGKYFHDREETQRRRERIRRLENLLR